MLGGRDFGECPFSHERHAPGRVTVIVDASAAPPVVHVLDDGPGHQLNPRLPADPMSERGRGLYIVNALVEELSISRRSAGGSHARAVLRV